MVQDNRFVDNRVQNNKGKTMTTQTIGHSVTRTLMLPSIYSSDIESPIRGDDIFSPITSAGWLS